MISRGKSAEQRRATEQWIDSVKKTTEAITRSQEEATKVQITQRLESWFEALTELIRSITGRPPRATSNGEGARSGEQRLEESHQEIPRRATPQEERSETSQSFKILCDLIRGMTPKGTSLPPMNLAEEFKKNDQKHQEHPPVEAATGEEEGVPVHSNGMSGSDNGIRGLTRMESTTAPTSLDKRTGSGVCNHQEDDQGRPIACQEVIPTKNSEVMSVNNFFEIEAIEASEQESNRNRKEHQPQLEHSKVIPTPLAIIVEAESDKIMDELADVLPGSIKTKGADGRMKTVEFYGNSNAHKLFVEMTKEGALLQTTLVKDKICVAKEMRLIVGADRGSPYLINFDPGGSFHVIDGEMNEGRAINIALSDQLGHKLADGVNLLSLKFTQDCRILIPFDRGRVGSEEANQGPIVILYDRGKRDVATSPYIEVAGTFMLFFDPGGMCYLEPVRIAMFSKFDNVGLSIIGLNLDCKVIKNGLKSWPFDRGKSDEEIRLPYDRRWLCVVQTVKRGLSATIVFDPGGVKILVLMELGGSCLFWRYFYWLVIGFDACIGVKNG